MKKIIIPMLAIFLSVSCESFVQETSVLEQKTKALETMKRIHQIDMRFKEILNKKIPFYHHANSIMELVKNAPSDFFEEVSVCDSWGNNILFFWDQNNNEYGIASPGNDGEFEGWDQRGFYNGDILWGYKGDIILINGEFVFGPDARPERNSPKLIAPALELFDKGDLNGSLKLFASFQKKYPFNLYANVYLGTSYFFLGRNQDAIDVLIHARRHFPNNSEIDLLLSLAYCENDSMQKAIQCLLSSNQKFNNDSYNLTGISSFQTEINLWIDYKENDFNSLAKSHEEIIDYYKNLNDFPHYSQVYSMIYYQLGVIQSKFQNNSSAIYFFKKSISIGKPEEIFFIKSRSELSKLYAKIV